jgi:integrase
MAMARQRGADPLIEDQLGVLVAAVAKRHHEVPGASWPATNRIEQRAGEPEIDLRLLARRGVHPHDRRRPDWLQRPHEATHRRVAARVAACTDAVEDGHHLDAVGEELAADDFFGYLSEIELVLLFRAVPRADKLKHPRDPALLSLLGLQALRTIEIMRANVDDVQRRGDDWALLVTARCTIGCCSSGLMSPMPCARI